MGGMEVNFQLTKVRTPRSQRYTTNFIIQTMDQQGYLIDTYFSYQMPPVMASRKITKKMLYLTSIVVGETSTMKFQFSSPVPLHSQDAMVINFPSTGLSQRLAFTYQSCKSSFEIVCTLIGLDDLRVQSISAGKQLPAGTTFDLEISMVGNPISTKSSDPLALKVWDVNGYEVTQSGTTAQELNAMMLFVSQPAELLFARVDHHSDIANEMTAFEFSIITRTDLPAGATIKVELPAQIQVSAPDVSCSTDSNPDQTVECFYSVKNRYILLKQVTTQAAAGGKVLTFEITGLINSLFAAPTDSFFVYTLDIAGNYIDQMKTGLTVTSSCDWPCRSCSPDKPTECRSCNAGKRYPLLYDGTCLETCPENYYDINGVCSQCGQDCLACEGADNICTRCHSGFHLLSNTCYTQCPDTYFSDWRARLCVSCESPCETCSKSTSTCTSCDQKQDYRYYFRETCSVECPVEVSVDTMGTCEACDVNCLTCEGAIDTCTSCRDGIYLDLSDNMCKDTCTAEITVATILTPAHHQKQDLVCELCHETCATCNPFNALECTKCRTDYKFNQADGLCLTECPAATAELYIPLTQDYLCLPCADGCSECMYSQDRCTACLPGKIFNDYACVDECPHGYGEVDRACVRDALFCEYGFIVKGNECVLDVAHCNEGYVLNTGDNLCIPLPGPQLPGVLLVYCAIWTILVLVRRHKKEPDMTQERLVTQLLGGYVLLQQLAYFVLFVLSFGLGYSFVTSVHLFASVAAVVLNLAAMIAYVLLLMNDLPFKYWREKNMRSTLVIFGISAIFSFKAIRFLVSKFWGKRQLDAIFEDKFRVFQRPLAALTCVQTLACVGPISYISVYVVGLIPIWGYEIRTLGMECLIMAVVIASLETYEFILAARDEKALPKINDLVGKPIRAKKTKELKQMAGFEPENATLVKDARMTTAMINHPSESSMLEVLVKQIGQKTNLKRLNESYEDKPIQSNFKKAKEQLNETRKHFELHRHQPAKEYTEKNVRHNELSSTPTQEVCDKVAQYFKHPKKTVIIDALDIYEARSEAEEARDEYEFKIHFQEQVAIHDKNHPNKPRSKSFDENVMRELYDDFGVESDFESELSWISYPPKKQFLADPYMMARAALFSEKIKYKFQYDNTGLTKAPEKLVVPKQVLIAARTQTVTIAQQGDPFVTDDSESSEEISVIESGVVKNIFGLVLDNITQGGASAMPSANSRHLASQDSAEMYLVNMGDSKKRCRKQTSLGDLGVASDELQDLTKVHLDAQVAEKEVLPGETEQMCDQRMEKLEGQSEDELENEIERLQELSMEMERIPKWKIDQMLAEEESQNEVAVDNDNDEDSSQEGEPIQLNKDLGRSKRERQLENAYAPDEFSLEQMASQLKQKLHRVTQITPGQQTLQQIGSQQDNQSVKQITTEAKGRKQSSIGRTEANEMLSSALNSSQDPLTINQEGRRTGQTHFLNQSQISEDASSRGNDNRAVSAFSEGRAPGSARSSNRGKKIFNKYEHGYLFDIKRPAGPKALAPVENYKPPVPKPFAKDKYKAFKSTKTMMQEQSARADLYQAKKATLNINRLKNMEQMYLRPGRQSVDDNHRRGLHSSLHKKFRKQNFIEDGAIIMRTANATGFSTGKRADFTCSPTKTSQELRSITIDRKSHGEESLMARDIQMVGELKGALGRMEKLRKIEKERNQSGID